MYNISGDNKKLIKKKVTSDDNRNLNESEENIEPSASKPTDLNAHRKAEKFENKDPSRAEAILSAPKYTYHIIPV